MSEHTYVHRDVADLCSLQALIVEMSLTNARDRENVDDRVQVACSLPGLDQVGFAGNAVRAAVADTVTDLRAGVMLSPHSITVRPPIWYEHDIAYLLGLPVLDPSPRLAALRSVYDVFPEREWISGLILRLAHQV